MSPFGHQRQLMYVKGLWNPPQRLLERITEPRTHELPHSQLITAISDSNYLCHFLWTPVHFPASGWVFEKFSNRIVSSVDLDRSINQMRQRRLYRSDFPRALSSFEASLL